MKAASNHFLSDPDIPVAILSAMRALVSGPLAAEPFGKALIAALGSSSAAQLEDSCLLDLAVDSLTIPGIQQVGHILKLVQNDSGCVEQLSRLIFHSSSRCSPTHRRLEFKVQG